MKIKMDGVEYEFPEVDSITMDEAIIVEKYSGKGLEELLPDEEGKTSLPMGAIKAFVVIAVKRARPDVSEKEIAATIGKIKLGELNDLLEQDEETKETDALPPVGNEASLSTSGDASSNGSESSLAAVPPNGTGRQDSPTEPTSDRETSAR